MADTEMYVRVGSSSVHVSEQARFYVILSTTDSIVMWSWHVAMRPGEFDILYVMYEIQHGWWSGRPDASPLLTRPLCFQIMLLVKEWGRRRERKDRDVKRFVIHRYMTHAMERGRLLTIHWAMETIGLWRQHVERTVCAGHQFMMCTDLVGTRVQKILIQSFCCQGKTRLFMYVSCFTLERHLWPFNSSCTCI